MKVIEDFVPFQMAIKLKEKGLTLSKEYIFGAYDEDGDLFSISEYNIEEYWCAYAPTISQVLKWLRYKQAIHIEATICTLGWYFNVFVYEFYEEEKEYGIKMEYQYGYYQSYEQAALAGIKYVLDNLI